MRLIVGPIFSRNWASGYNAVGAVKNMTNKMKLVWRLSKLPSPDELVELVKNKIITQEEAKEIIVSSETEEDRDKKSLEAEVKFLKEVIMELAKMKSTIVDSIRYVEKPYYKQYPWYGDTVTYLCSSGTGSSNNLIG